MSQRITLAFVALLVVACLGSTGLAWMLYRDGQLLNQESRAINQAILTRLTMLEASSAEQPQEQAPLSLEWAKLRIRLVQEKKGGAPAAGFTALLQGNAINPAQELELKEKSDETGLIDFGPVRPGAYALAVVSPWKQLHHYSRINQQGRSSLVLQPGKTTEIEIVCPSQALKMAEVAFAIDWPEEVAKKTPLLFCHFAVRLRDIKYDFHGAPWYLSSREFHVMLTPEGKVIEKYSMLPMLEQTSQPRSEVKFASGRGPIQVPNFLSETFLYDSTREGSFSLYLEEVLASQPTIRTDIRHYRLKAVSLFLPTDDAEVPEGKRAYQVSLLKIRGRPSPIHVPFEAIPGELNTWHIKLPEILVEETPEKPKSVGYLPESGRQR